MRCNKSRLIRLEWSLRRDTRRDTTPIRRDTSDRGILLHPIISQASSTSTFKLGHSLFFDGAARRGGGRVPSITATRQSLAEPEARRAVANCCVQQKTRSLLRLGHTPLLHRHTRVLSSACTRTASVRRDSSSSPNFVFL